MEEFNSSELQEENDCTLESMCLKYRETFPVTWPKKKKRKSAMLECPQITKKKTSKDKLKSSIDSTQEQKSSKISEVDSISEKKDL
jgi:hypothetical protein